MPLLNGIDAAVQINNHLPAVKLLFVTMHDSPAYLASALHAGANGYVLKSAASEELLEAIDSAQNGSIYVSSRLSRDTLERFRDSSSAATALHLSLREREILQLIAEGRIEKEIAFLLNISIKTVGFHPRTGSHLVAGRGFNGSAACRSVSRTAAGGGPTSELSANVPL